MASGGRGYGGYGRGGRYASILQAMQAPTRRPGESEAPAQQEQPAVGTTHTPHEAPPQRAGRIDHLQRFLDTRDGDTDAAPVASPISSPPRPETAQPYIGGRGYVPAQSEPFRDTAAPPPQPRALGRGLARLHELAAGRGQRPAADIPAPEPVAAPSQRPVQQPLAAPSQRPSQQAPAAQKPSSPYAGGDVAPREAEEERPSRLAAMLRRMELQEPTVIKKGTAGESVPICANYIRLRSKSEGFYQYAVSFTPQIDSRNMRFGLLMEHVSVIGSAKNFDGCILFLPHKLPQEETVLKSRRNTDGAEITVIVKLVKVIPPGACVQVFNVLFKKIMAILQMTQVGRHYYNPHSPAQIPQHKLEVWPGYITAIQEFEGGLMLLTDVSHRVLRIETVLELMHKMTQEDPRNFHDNFRKVILGATVLTRYNNKTYRVDDVKFDMNPRNTFTKEDGSTLTYLEYYKKQYNKTIYDENQPLLIHRVKKREMRGRQRGDGDVPEQIICLVPELCYMTGLTDDMREDYRVMKDLAHHTRVTPMQRQRSLRMLCENVNKNREAKKLLSDWGLELDNDTIQVEGRGLPSEAIHFGNDKQVRGTPEASWGGEIGRSHVKRAVDINNWLLLFTKRDSNSVSNFVRMIRKVCPDMGLHVREPKMLELHNDRTETYTNAIQSNLNPQTQLVMAIFPSSRDDRYNALKKLCCVQCPVPSQVIISKTIRNEKIMKSVTQKVMLQVNCKLGGELWSLSIPTGQLIMVVGIDVYHDKPGGRQSIGGFVASLNQTCTRWYSRVCIQMKGEELIPGLKKCFVDSLMKFQEVNHKLPQKIIVYRDGVGDGQLRMVRDMETPQLEQCFSMFGESYHPDYAVIVVQKRINQRLFAITRGGQYLDNPRPGTIMDNIITRREWYDFFLVSQHVRQGTVSPTHYIVVHDSLNWKVDIVQRLTYKMTHLYYNWPGTVRVPAPCQYAHKLAYLVGQNLHKEPSLHLADRLFFL